MSQPPDSDNELDRRLAGARDELIARLPHADPRVETLIAGGGEPIAAQGSVPLPLDVSPLELAGKPSRRRDRLAVLAAIAATLVFFVGAAALAFQGSDGPSLDTLAPAAAEDPDTADPVVIPEDSSDEESDEAEEDGEPDRVEDETGDDESGDLRWFFEDGPFAEFSEDGFELHREWLLCLTDRFGLFLEDRFETPFSADACGEFPALPDLDFDFVPGELGPKLDEWFEFGPELWNDVCEETEHDEGGFSLSCVWPPCDGAEDCTSTWCFDAEDHDTGCVEFGFGLDADGLGLDLELDLGDLSELPGFSDDFHFPWDSDLWPFDDLDRFDDREDEMNDA